MKKLSGYQKKFYWLTLVVVLVAGCRGRGGNYGNPGYTQPQYSSSTYYGGYGTDYYTGCAIFIMSPTSGYAETYSVSVSGAGSYTIPYGTNQIQFNYLTPGSYPFSVYVNETGQYINGYVSVYSSTTSQVNVYPN